MRAGPKSPRPSCAHELRGARILKGSATSAQPDMRRVLYSIFPFTRLAYRLPRTGPWSPQKFLTFALRSLTRLGLQREPGSGMVERLRWLLRMHS